MSNLLTTPTPAKKYFSKRSNVQCQLLSSLISECFKDFVSKHPNLKVSLSTFKRYSPKHVKIMKFNKLIQCLCERCENVKLEVKALNRAGADIGTLTEVLDSAMCPKTNGW